MKYKVGDKVRIKSLDWYNENKDENGNIPLTDCTNSEYNFIKIKRGFCGKVMTISSVSPFYYDMVEDNGQYYWTDEMIEGLVEEESDITPKFGEISEDNNLPTEWKLPDGFEFRDENGNVINATKIVLEKKKKEYPKTFEECVHVLEGEIRTSLEQMNTFRKLIDARNAYWKIAGEKMGLGKPWKPDWKGDDTHKFIIHVIKDEIRCGVGLVKSDLLSFPTEEMRDAFYENFKELIEQCKELL